MMVDTFNVHNSYTEDRLSKLLPPVHNKKNNMGKCILCSMWHMIYTYRLLLCYTLFLSFSFFYLLGSMCSVSSSSNNIVCLSIFVGLNTNNKKTKLFASFFRKKENGHARPNFSKSKIKTTTTARPIVWKWSSVNFCHLCVHFLVAIKLFIICNECNR